MLCTSCLVPIECDSVAIRVSTPSSVSLCVCDATELVLGILCDMFNDLRHGLRRPNHRCLCVGQTKACGFTLAKSQVKPGEDASFNGSFGKELISTSRKYDRGVCHFTFGVPVPPVDFLGVLDHVIQGDLIFNGNPQIAYCVSAEF